MFTCSHSVPTDTLQKTTMHDAESVFQVLLFVIVVIDFLLNTCRAEKAIVLCKECLIVLKSKALEKVQKHLQSLYPRLHCQLLDGYVYIENHPEAEECKEKLLIFLREGDDMYLPEKARVTVKLAHWYVGQGKHEEARHLFGDALRIVTKTGQKEGERACWRGLGVVFHSLGEYQKAVKCLNKALAISKETRDRKQESINFTMLGVVFSYASEHTKAKKCYEQSNEIAKEQGNKKLEAINYGYLGTVFFSQHESHKAKEYLLRALSLARETGDKHSEAVIYANLSSVFNGLSDYYRAEEYLRKALNIMKELGDKNSEAIVNTNLGAVFISLGEYNKAKEYVQEALQFYERTSNKREKANCYSLLGTVLTYMGEYDKAEKYLQKALPIREQFRDKEGEATDYGNLGALYLHAGLYAKGKEYIQESLAIAKEIGHKRLEAEAYGNLGAAFHNLGELAMANEYQEKALELSKEIGHIKQQFRSHINLALNLAVKGNITEAVSNLLSSIRNCEKMRRLLRDHDQFKISFLEEHLFPYHILSSLLCHVGSFSQALCIAEMGRARALADNISDQYSVKDKLSVIPHSQDDIKKVIQKENNCCCLYISSHKQGLSLWVIKQDEKVSFRRGNCCEFVIKKHVMNKFFFDDFFKTFHNSTQENCEDRSLFSSNVTYPASELFSAPPLRVEEDQNKNSLPQPLTFAQLYRVIIAPAADLLTEPEIIIVPDRTLYGVPFVAFQDENGKYLAETFRIRIIPSLTILRLIQNSPADYHSETGALIVGEPLVSDVFYKGQHNTLSPLPFARKEAEIIGKLLPGSQVLLGEHATKQALFQYLHSASLIHVAAHGDAERGEIALAPPSSIVGPAQEQDYLLTMGEISQVRLRAKLVVLSCCHSASGQIRSEGVVGIARAFLASGARSVLVALWAIEDQATEKFMTRFYERLLHGDSASESLHQAMKWMRANKFSDVGQWAPFTLIGDNVKFDFQI